MNILLDKKNSHNFTINIIVKKLAMLQIESREYRSKIVACSRLTDTESRDLRSFEIRFEFESDVPIRFESDGRMQKFRIVAPATFAVVP